MAKNMLRSRKSIIIAFVAVLALAGAGIAYAYWTSTGDGVGEATTGTAGTLDVTSQPAVGTIEPGGPGQTIVFTVINNGTEDQYLDSVAIALADENGVAWVPPTGCLIEDFTATISTPPAAGVIEPGDSMGGVATVTLDNTGVNQDACQEQTIPLYFTVTVAP